MNITMTLRDRLQSGTSLLDITRAILEELEILQYWDQKDETDRVQNLQELLNTIAEYEREEENPSLEGYLEKSVLISGIDALDESQQNVTMMTLHNAKGLEYDHVFIVGMEEGLFPHRNSLEDSQSLEEERRLCYGNHSYHEQAYSFWCSFEGCLWAAELSGSFKVFERDWRPFSGSTGFCIRCLSASILRFSFICFSAQLIQLDRSLNCFGSNFRWYLRESIRRSVRFLPELLYKV